MAEGIIDFRVRPPYKSFAELPLFRDREEWTKAPHEQSGLASSRGECVSHRLKSMPHFIDELHAAGIARAVVPGRQAAGKGDVPNEDVADLLQEYPDTFIGFGSIGSHQLNDAGALVERFKEWGFKGVSFEPPWFEPPLHFSDTSLAEVYRAIAESGLVLMLTSSIYVGPDLTYSDPIHIQRVAEQNPDLPIVVSHAAWPNVMGMLGVAFKHPNVHVMPDLYGNTPALPGVRDLTDAANSFLSERLVYASAYPIRSLEESVAGLRQWDVSDEVLHKMLHANASRILGLG